MAGKTPFLVVVGCLALPLAVLGQENPSLGEVARQTRKDLDKKKVARTSESPKVYTNEDLRTAQGNVTVLPDSSSSAASPGAAAITGGSDSKEPTEAELRERKRADLQAQLDAQADFIKRLRQAADENQSELNDLSNYLLGGRRASLTSSVEQYNQKIAEAQRAIDDLEEQARRAGISLSRP
jgi:hypothetical protein